MGAVALIAFFIFATPAAAQDLGSEESARFRFGPLRITPSIALTNVGVDDNVFNESENPRRDTTAALGPASDFWLHLGRSRVLGRASAQYLYFAKYDHERAWNTQSNVRWEVPLARTTPFVTGTYADTKQRAGYEIDTRARAIDQGGGFGADTRLSGKTTMIVAVRRTTLSYDDDSEFRGESLATALDRRSDEGQVSLRFRVTPLTTFVVGANAVSDRFTRDALRNADSIQILPGFEFKPALISGTVFVGYRHFHPLDPLIPNHDGVVASVNAGYVWRYATRIEGRWDRNVAYSYDNKRPYYGLNDVGLSVTRRFTRSWEAAVRGARQTLDYVTLATADRAPERIDHGSQVGLGLGYFVGERLRLGVDVNRLRRDTVSFQLDQYRAVKIGASVTYGLPR